MKIHDRAVPTGISNEILERIRSDVHFALNSIATVDGRFVVNDTAWFIKRGKGRITPCVMNSANFISKNFQNSLCDFRGWEKELTLAGQTIDNYREVSTSGIKYRLPPDISFLEFFRKHCEKKSPEDLRKEFLAIWHIYVKLGVTDLTPIDESVHRLFKKVEGQDTLKIGLEFETGNIASAFRALNKLESLFVSGQIDLGIFVTSIDKVNAAARIWPQSNRNGSFAELENRMYRNNLTVPLWEFGFEPDEFRIDAPYLDSCSLYTPTRTERIERGPDGEFEVYLRGSEQILKPIKLLQSHHFDVI
jgi:hypothetical protein